MNMTITRAVGRACLTMSWLLLCGIAVPRPALSDPSEGWVATSPMNVARNWGGLVTLQNGQVLAAGGMNAAGQQTGTSELYDPSTGQWSFTGSMNQARFGFDHAVMLPDGRVFVAGGAYIGGDVSSAEIYDPSTGQWTQTGSLHIARRFPAVVGLKDGRVLVATGANGPPTDGRYQSTAEIWDPSTGQFSFTGNVNYPRDSPEGLLLHDGRVLVYGGYGPPTYNSAPTDELFDPSTGTWSVTGNLLEAPGGACSTVLADGRVLVAGSGNGNDAQLFDPTTGTWAWAAPMHYARGNCGAIVLPDNRVLVAGGHDPNGGGEVAESELYDPASNTWSDAGAMPFPESDYYNDMTLLPDGRVLRAGGFIVGGFAQAAAQIFTPTPEDTTPPVVTPLVNGAAPSAGWYTSNATVTWQVQDPESGISSSTGCGSTTLTSDTTGTTLTCSATNGAGLSSSQSVTVKVDETPPAIQCAAPDGQWHATDVSIGCTASDGTSGLANASDASFSLSTSVSSGTETNNAPTGTYQVCDVAGNCATAGPISGNMVDKKAPSITLTAPGSTTYLLNQAVASNYSCSDGGSGVASCSGPVAAGSTIDTSSVGTTSFTVNASDIVGNSSSQTATYTVAYNAGNGAPAACILYDPTKANNAGSTIPIKLELCDANGNNLSSPNITVTAVGQARDPGNADPGGTFRYDSTLAPGGGYIYNLQTKG